MLAEVENFLRLKHHIAREDRILCAVSGGVDSMVLLDILRRLDQNIVVIHVNYHLRGKDSHLDARHVRAYCAQYHIHCIIADAPIMDKANLQEVARKLRYELFEKQSKKINAKYIATAHHLNDQLESFFINLLRGSSLKGLTGISERRNKIIRPLLYTKRAQIEAYATKHQLAFRIDKSNLGSDYLRNRLRHYLFPILLRENPAFLNTFSNTLERLKATDELLNDLSLDWKQRYTEPHKDYIVININKIPLKQRFFICYTLLKPFGINWIQFKNIYHSTTGKQIISSEYRVLKDRGRFLIRRTKPNPMTNLPIRIPSAAKKNYPIGDNFFLKVSPAKSIKDFSKKGVEYMDQDKIKFPIIIRPWEKGDRFAPLGMKGKHQKVQDFFTNKKLNRFEKEKILIARDEDKIIWVIGHRISELVKVTDQSTNIIRMEYVTKHP